MATATVAAPPQPRPTYSKEDETLLVFARLMEGGQEDEETCRDLDTLTALLNDDADLSAAHKDHSSICKVVDVDLVDTMLAYLDLRQPDIVRGRAVLTTSAYLRAAGEQGEENLATFFRSRIAQGTYDDYIVAFCVAAATFPIVPALTSRLFLAEGFLSSLGPLMRRKWKSRKVETACLEMLNAACMNSKCRDAVDTYCADWLEEVVDQDPADVVRTMTQDPESRIEGGTVSLRRHSEQVLNLAAVILTKLRAVPTKPLQARPETSRVETATTSVEDLTNLFCRILKTETNKKREKVKESVRGVEEVEKAKEKEEEAVENFKKEEAEEEEEEGEAAQDVKKEGEVEEAKKGQSKEKKDKSIGKGTEAGKVEDEAEEEDGQDVVANKKYAIEGLAYASLRPEVKEMIARDGEVLRSIAQSLESGEAPPRSPMAYGALSILSNLVRYRPVLSEEEAKLQQLRSYADAAAKQQQPDRSSSSSNNNNKNDQQQQQQQQQQLDSDASVSARCKLVFEAGAVPALVSHSKKGPSPPSLGIVVSIILALSVTPVLRGRLAQQGAVSLLISNQDRLLPPDRRVAAQALARILISTHPFMVLGGNRPTSMASAVRPLLSILAPDPHAETRDLLPTFEALMALTNLASVEDGDAPGSTRRLIVDLAWPAVEEQLLSSNERVCRAAVELACNLVESARGAALFADGTPQARSRLHVLLALADAPDEKTRSAAGGALYGLTRAREAAVRGICEREGGVRVVLAMCRDNSDDLRHRAALTVVNMLASDGETGVLARKKIREEGGLAALKEGAKLTRQPEVMQALVAALEMLTAEEEQEESGGGQA